MRITEELANNNEEVGVTGLFHYIWEFLIGGIKTGGKNLFLRTTPL